ncbi:MAG: GxxExxY protein [Bacteroidetes bacterium]|nr:GxxExxY protein [Bacteroidota bacterium]
MQKHIDELTYEIVGTTIEVQKKTGRELLKNVYRQCLKEGLLHGKMFFLTEMRIPVLYKNEQLEIDFR